VPVLFRRNRSCEITRCAGYHRSSRQEVFTRHERSDPGSLEGEIRKADPTSWRAGKSTVRRIAVAVFLRAKATGLPQNRRMITKNIGMLLLAIYLILVGITTLFHIGIGAIVMGVVALIAGILILIGK